MVYKKYQQIVGDQDYYCDFNNSHLNEGYSMHGMIDMRYNLFRIYSKKLKAVWKKHMGSEYELASKQNTRLGKFIREFPLPLKEFLCLMDLIEHGESMPWEDDYGENRFKKYKVRFNSSFLKKHKLVFLIQDPLKPMKKEYVVSYKAQLALKGKLYSDAYQQLDMVLISTYSGTPK